MSENDSESRRSDDPSLEEILASIRQIVFEKDDVESASPARAGDAGNAGPEASETAPEAPTDDAPADEPLHGDEGDAAEAGGAPHGDGIAAETLGAARTEPQQDAASPEPPDPAAGTTDPADRADPAGPVAADDSGDGPGDSVLLLTDMIAPDGSVVRIDPSPVLGRGETPSPADGSAPAPDPEAGGGARALSAATQDELAATVRAWLDRNAPEMVDRAARRELRKLADRQD